MRIPLLSAAIIVAASTSLVRAQSITTEVSTSAGITSEENVSSVATQVRAFGSVEPRLRYYMEAAWARTSDEESNAFGSAYPYENRVQMIEAYADGLLRKGHGLLDVRAGRFRTPFGISAASDHAYTGFLRAPLLRYGGSFALSNTALEHGVDVAAGIPALTLEASAGSPADVGSAHRRSGLDALVRVQSLIGPFVVGASHLETQPDEAFRFASGSAAFTGVDLRWMQNGVQLRGEWITGHPFQASSTSGWYADAILHRIEMGRVTAIARIEALDYTTPTAAFNRHSQRQTLGARIRLHDSLSVQANLLHQTGQVAEYEHMAIDIGATYSLRPH